MVSAVALLQGYMRERAARQQFLLVVALARAQRAQATAMEHRRAALEATERFEKSFGYICTYGAASARACAARRSVWSDAPQS